MAITNSPFPLSTVLMIEHRFGEIRQRERTFGLLRGIDTGSKRNSLLLIVGIIGD